MPEVSSFEILIDWHAPLYCIKKKGSSCKPEPAEA